MLVWDGDGLWVCGAEVAMEPAPAVPFYVVPERWQTYRRVADLPSDTRQYVVVDPARRTVRLHVSPFGEWPLVYTLADGLCLVAPAIRPLVRELAARGRKLDWDRVGLTEALLKDYPFRHRTYFTGVHKTRAGEDVTLDLTSGGIARTMHWVLPFAPSPDQPDHTVAEAVAALEQLAADTPLPERTVHPLSGGYDSRWLLCQAVAQGGARSSFTFGSYGSAEQRIARHIADSLGVSHGEYELRPEGYATYGAELSLMTGGLSTPAHRHLYSALRELEPRAPVVLGYMGDVYAGDSQVAENGQFALTEAEALDRFVDHNLLSVPRPIVGKAKRRFWDALPAEIQAGIRADLADSLQECCTRNAPCFFDEYIHNVERQCNLIAWIFCVCELVTPALRPYASRHYAEFFNMASYADRHHRRLFVQAAEAVCPQQFPAPSSDRPYGRRLPVRMQGKLKMARNALQLATDLATGGRLVAHSPFLYEQQHYVIGRHYRAELEAALAAGQDVLQCDLSPLRFTRIPVWHNTYRHFRLLGLQAILKDEGYRAVLSR